MKKGQSTTEYLLLLTVVVVIVVLGFQSYLKRTQNASEVYFNSVGGGILGEPHPCGDTHCDPNFETDETCPTDCD